jgi:hypothetical protein
MAAVWCAFAPTSYSHGTDGEVEPEDLAEWWCRCAGSTPGEESGLWEKGMFANQNSARQLRQEFTLERLAQDFRLDEKS